VTRTNSSVERPADVLAKLATIRMQGSRPALPVFVTTERNWTERYAARRHPVIEVWRRDLGQLDFRALGGLRVEACVGWTSYEERLELFEALRDARPSELHWYAINPRGTGPSSHWMGCMWLKDGVPMDWHTPFDRMLQSAMEENGGAKVYGEKPFKPGEQLVSYGRV
jgi:hypothetical protein